MDKQRKKEQSGQLTVDLNAVVRPEDAFERVADSPDLRNRQQDRGMHPRPSKRGVWCSRTAQSGVPLDFQCSSPYDKQASGLLLPLVHTVHLYLAYEREAGLHANNAESDHWQETDFSQQDTSKTVASMSFAVSSQ